MLVHLKNLISYLNKAQDFPKFIINIKNTINKTKKCHTAKYN